MAAGYGKGHQHGRPIGVRYSLSYCARLNWMQKELQTSVEATGPSLEHDLTAPSSRLHSRLRSLSPSFARFGFFSLQSNLATAASRNKQRECTHAHTTRARAKEVRNEKRWDEKERREEKEEMSEKGAI